MTFLSIYDLRFTTPGFAKVTTRQGIDLNRKGDLGFIIVVLAAYISALSYLREPYTLGEAVFLIIGSLVYLVAGIYGFQYCKRRGSLPLSIAYFVFQMALARSIIHIGNAGFIFLIMLPLASQSVILLPRRWVLAFCVLFIVVIAVPAWQRYGWALAVRSSIINLAGIVFVVVFTEIAVSERKARAEIERLAAELGDANRKLRAYAAQVEELATTKERNRLAREIHDSLGHYLTVINVQIEAARAVFDTERQRALDGIQKAQLLTQEGLQEVRRSVAALRASQTTGRPLPEALKTLVEECRAAGIETEFNISGVPRPLAPQAELTLYRAAQEGLTNVRKHAHASRASVHLDYEDDGKMRLVIEDNGVGGNETDGGFGLLGVRERAQLLDGEVRVRTAAGKGFVLELELPV